jgi:hypothetical protein
MSKKSDLEHERVIRSLGQARDLLERGTGCAEWLKDHRREDEFMEYTGLFVKLRGVTLIIHDLIDDTIKLSTKGQKRKSRGER